MTEDGLAGLYKHEKIWRKRSLLLEGIWDYFETVKHIW